MDFAKLFQQAGRLVWQHKAWWLLGALLSSGTIITTALRLWLPTAVPPAWRDVDAWLDVVEGRPLPAPDLTQLGWNLTALAVAAVLLTLLIWLLATMAEGALITAVLHPDRPLRVSLRRGIALLGRFIAIDALVFLPWFLLALAAMLLLLLATLGAAAATFQGSGETAVALLTLGWLCSLPLACLLIPVGYASLLYRQLAFRDAALTGHGVRAATRHTWHVVRANLGPVILLALLVWGVTTLPLTAVNGLTWPLLTLSLGTGTAVQLVAFIGRLFLFLLIVALAAILHALAAAVWTLAYAEMLNRQ